MSVRARIILACSEPGFVYGHVATEVGVSRMTVNAWRRRFTQDRLAGLTDNPGRPAETRTGTLQPGTRTVDAVVAAGRRHRRRWRCGRRSCWRARSQARRTSRSPTTCGSRRAPSPSGVLGSLTNASKGWPTNRGPDARRRSCSTGSKMSSPAPSNNHHPMRRTGPGRRWPRRPDSRSRRSDVSGAHSS